MSRVSYMTEVMKPEIWEKFPEDLFDIVLARLPIAKIICFRTVCRQWNNLITSQRFSRHCAQFSQVNPWFYITYGYEDNYKTMYDPFMKRWYNPTTFETPAFPVSSAGGLVCFVDSRGHNPNLYVSNPITQSFKKLPIGSIKSWRLLGMTMNRSAGYRVLKLGYREYEIYESVTKCWSYLGNVPNCTNFAISNHVSIDNTLYFKHANPEKIISCDTSTGVWTQHLIQAPLHSSDLTLAESDGRIMLVGLVRENYSKCVCIWEVQKMTFLLKEVDRKTIQFSGFNRMSHLSCMGIQGFLLCYLKSYDKYRMITYNISTREWVKVPVPFRTKLVDHYRHVNNHIRVRGTAFQPCLSAMP